MPAAKQRPGLHDRHPIRFELLRLAANMDEGNPPERV